MYPTDPSSISGLPSREKAVIFGTALGLGTVVLGTRLVKIPLLSSNQSRKHYSLIFLGPLHLVAGGVLGALGGALLHYGSTSVQERVLIGYDYYQRRSQEVNKA